MFRRLSWLLAALLILTFVVPTSAQEPVTFVFGEFGNPIQLNGATTTDGISFRVVFQGCEGLVKFDRDTVNVVPSLAESWETSEDGLEWTFTLREGVTFHDGTPFNADAVVYNFESWRFTDHESHWPEAFFEYYDSQFGGPDDASLITSVEALDEYTVKFTLAQEMGAFLPNMAMKMFQISSPAALAEYGFDYGTPDVGFVCTGAYKFVEWVPDDHVTLDLYEGYWGEVEGNVERIIIRAIPDSAARFAALQAGEIHMKEQASPEELEIIAESDDMYWVPRPGFNTCYLAFSYRIEEFHNPLVRQAISMALDRQTYVAAFYAEGAVVANQFGPVFQGWARSEELDANPVRYDPEGAQALLAEAGYPDGFSEVNILALDDEGNVTDEVEETIPLTLFWQPVVRPYNPDGETIGQAMAANLAAIGIEVRLDNAGDWATYLDLRRRGEMIGLYQLGWTGDNGDPDNFIGYFFSECNLAREGYFNFPEVCDPILQARFLTDRAQREALYIQAEEAIRTQAARLFIAHGPVPLVFRSNVSGYIPNPLGDEFFGYVTVE